MLVRLCVDYRIKPHIPPFEQIPANSVKFQPCDCTAQVEYLRVSFNHLRFNTHSLQCGLIGSLILVGIHTFMHECQFI